MIFSSAPNDFLNLKYSDELYHHGIKGQKWGIRRYQNADGSLTPEGIKRYLKNGDLNLKKMEKDSKKNKISLDEYRKFNRRKEYEENEKFIKQHPKEMKQAINYAKDFIVKDGNTKKIRVWVGQEAIDEIFSDFNYNDQEIAYDAFWQEMHRLGIESY